MTNHNELDVEKRRSELERYLQAILLSPDHRIRESDLFKSFLDMSIYVPDGAAGAQKESMTPSEWLDEFKQTEMVVRELRSSIYNHKDRPGSSIETRKKMSELSSRVDQLEKCLDAVATTTVEQLSRIELSRRRDQLLQLKRQKDEFGRILQPLSTYLNEPISLVTADRGQLLSQASTGPTPRSSRKFGVAQETPDTINKDNSQLLQHQTEVMKTQEESIGVLGQIIKRQKEIGLAIGNELDVQNEMLDEMDDRVAITCVNVKGVQKRLEKVRKG